ncbi:MAG: hypothetical protein AAGA63_06425, partial [Pseudomonadota bacterium]
MHALRSLHTETSWSEDNVEPAPIGAIINFVRIAVLECRSSAQVDLFKACAVLSLEKTMSLKAHADALAKCLPQALDARPVFFRPGVKSMSFDEAWLQRLATSIETRDTHSTDFLLRSRV